MARKKKVQPENQEVLTEAADAPVVEVVETPVAEPVVETVAEPAVEVAAADVATVEAVEFATVEAEETQAPAKKKGMKEDPVFHTVNCILLWIVAIISIVPFFNIISKALSTQGKPVMFLPQGFTWFNMDYIFSNGDYFRAFGMSVIITLIGTVLSVGFMFMAAYPLSKKDLPFRKGIMLFFMVIMLFSGGMVPNYFVMKMYGLYDTPFSLVFPSVVQVYNLILLKNNLEGIPAEIEESATIDGANNGTILVKILLPLAVPSIASVALFTAVTYWNNYTNAMIYIFENDKFYPLAYYIQKFITEGTFDPILESQLNTQKAYIDAAMIVMSILPIVCVYPFVLKFFVSGLTVGSVKG